MGKSERTHALACLDTEATTVEHAGHYIGVLYSWQYLYCRDGQNLTRNNVAGMTDYQTGRDVWSLYELLSDELDRAYRDRECLHIAVHNLSYDYAFLRIWLADVINADYVLKIAARSTTKLLALKIYRDDTLLMVIFDTLSIFGKSLRNLGDSLGFEKLTIDYGASIAPDTVLTTANQDYNGRDVYILAVAISQTLITRPDITLDTLGVSVLTKTGILRRQDRLSPNIGAVKMLYKRKSRAKAKPKTKNQYSKNPKSSYRLRALYDLNRADVSEHQFTSLADVQAWESYSSTINKDVKGCYAGGVNLCNPDFIGTTSRDVISYDLKSAYPGIICSYRIPTGPEHISPENFAGYEHLLTETSPDPVDMMGTGLFWIGTIDIYDLIMSETWFKYVGDSSITESMIYQYYRDKDRGDIEIEAGRLVMAKHIRLTVSKPVYHELCLQYDFERVEFVSLTVYTGWAYPSLYTIVRTLHHYREKTAAKVLGKHPDASYARQCASDGLITEDEAERFESGDIEPAWLDSFVFSHKANVNSIYGIEVTDPLRTEYDLDDGTSYIETVETDAEAQFEAYKNTSRNSKMWREAGVCIPLFNRYKLIYCARMIAEAGAYVLYADTDSLKVKGMTPETFTEVMKPIQDKIQERTQQTVAHCLDRINGKTDTPVPYPAGPDFEGLGLFAYEETYPYFCAMGHKRYAFSPDNETWKIRASGYDIRVLENLACQLKSDELGDLVPRIVLGFGNRYDSSTGIASAQDRTGAISARVSFEAWNTSDGPAGGTHVYSGETCPGFGIVDAGKIMNDVDDSAINLQRYTHATMIDPHIADTSFIDIAYRDGSFILGKRGTIAMDFRFNDNGSDWTETEVIP